MAPQTLAHGIPRLQGAGKEQVTHRSGQRTPFLFTPRMQPSI
jgi:hypothetical protein